VNRFPSRDHFASCNGTAPIEVSSGNRKINRLSLTNDVIESPVLVWVADHRHPHKYSDRQGDPHSPWRFGTGGKAVAVTA